MSPPLGMISRANRTSLNVGAFQHILNDLFAFIATAVAGVIMVLAGFWRADAIATLMLVVLMIKAGLGSGVRGEPNFRGAAGAGPSGALGAGPHQRQTMQPHNPIQPRRRLSKWTAAAPATPTRTALPRSRASAPGLGRAAPTTVHGPDMWQGPVTRRAGRLRSGRPRPRYDADPGDHRDRRTLPKGRRSPTLAPGQHQFAGARNRCRKPRFAATRPPWSQHDDEHG